jgi:hypothetical protein
MIARPILFSAPMIRALLAGTKTQTRRALKCQPIDIIPMPKAPDREWVILEQREPEPKGKVVRCRFGAPGDVLWCRETWARNANQLSDTYIETSTVYRADGEQRALDNGLELPWRPSIHMPRWASRLTLRITDVRVQRLQEISEADAMAEGIQKIGTRWEANGICATPVSACDAYRALWEYINGAGSWAANPWVWCVSFSVEKRNVDDVLRDARAAA